MAVEDNIFNDFGRYGVYVEPDASRSADCDVNENVNQVSASNSQGSVSDWWAWVDLNHRPHPYQLLANPV
jgi:hypothetical protein